LSRTEGVICQLIGSMPFILWVKSEWSSDNGSMVRGILSNELAIAHCFSLVYRYSSFCKKTA